MEGSRQTVGTTDSSEMLKPLRVLQSRSECTRRTGGKMTEVWMKDPALMMQNRCSNSASLVLSLREGSLDFRGKEC